MRAWGWARVSSREQREEGHSLGAQEEAVRRYCEREGLDLDRMTTVAESATRGDRDEWTAMISDLARAVRRGSVMDLVAAEVDRLVRTGRDAVRLDELRRDGLRIHLVREGEILGPDSRSSALLLWRVRVAVAEHEIEHHRERVRAGMHAAAEAGLWPHWAPLGYRNERIDGRSIIAPCPERGDEIRGLFERFSVGDLSLAEATAWARERGIRGKRGGELQRSTVHWTLRSPIYAGRVLWRGVERPGAHEPLVDAATWDRVQILLDDRQRREGPARFEHLFAGLLECGHCGCAMVTQVVRRPRRTYTYLRCSWARGRCPEPMVREERVIEAVVERLRALHVVRPWLGTIRAVARRSASDAAREREGARSRLAAELERIERRQRTAYDDRLDGRISPDEYDALARRWRSERAAHRARLAELDAAGDDLDERCLALVETASRAAEAWQEATRERKRRMLVTALSNRRWRDGGLLADWREPFSSLSDAATAGTPHDAPAAAAVQSGRDDWTAPKTAALLAADEETLEAWAA